MMKRLVTAIVVLCAVILPARAAENPSSFVQGLGNEVLSLLDRQNTAGEDASACFRKLLVADFDIQTIGRFVLGTYWRVATPEQQQEYMKLFEALVVDVYNERFKDYSSETFDVTGEIAESARDTRVRSRIIRQDKPEVGVEWRVRSKDGAFRIVDVSVEGVSMSLTQRSEFAAVIDRNGGRVQALIDKLADDRKKRDEAAAAEAAQFPSRPQVACP